MSSSKILPNLAERKILPNLGNDIEMIDIGPSSLQLPRSIHKKISQTIYTDTVLPDVLCNIVADYVVDPHQDQALWSHCNHGPPFTVSPDGYSVSIAPHTAVKNWSSAISEPMAVNLDAPFHHVEMSFTPCFAIISVLPSVALSYIKVTLSSDMSTSANCYTVRFAETVGVLFDLRSGCVAYYHNGNTELISPNKVYHMTPGTTLTPLVRSVVMGCSLFPAWNKLAKATLVWPPQFPPTAEHIQVFEKLSREFELSRGFVVDGE